MGDIEAFPIRFDNIVYPYYDKTRDARSRELSRVKPEGTPKREGLYLTLNSDSEFQSEAAQTKTMSPKLHCFANLDLFALSVKKVALKKSENIYIKLFSKYNIPCKMAEHFSKCHEF